ncbi:hypothetical protein NSK_001738 [Nannochloropsis salina CCMP1776]|uniref:Uncharacterized protein n=1 Tax=Nannochloropsis salina CCMP1776 TaxID=1027361 RepID=A0A4D9D7W4_9STRA|nr:hypothetical protein NSK_001738 [Nannochloropsis salina CCMP1776]|eukprot:TFJ87406.1 hypothetical protein NSK_001738 [Nannochloropsis salina CCMP1776]
MFLALKLLVVLGILSYGVATVLTSDHLTLAGFQAPLNHFLRGGRLYPATVSKPSPSTSGTDPHHLPHHQPPDGGMNLLRRPWPWQVDSSVHTPPGALKALTRRRQPPAGATTSFFEYWGDSKLITTVDALRTRHGQGSFWGDLNHVETRYVYHQLLPRHLLQDAQAHPDALAVEDLARLASTARHAARLYARERSSLPLRLAAGLYDGFRHLSTFGRWSWTGMSYEEVWCKYESKIKKELTEEGRAGQVGQEELNRMVAFRILEKSCETNSGFDRFAQVERAHDILLAAAARKEGRKGGRKREEAWEEEARKRRKKLMADFATGQVPAWDGAEEKKEKGKGWRKEGPWKDKESPLLPLLKHFEKLGGAVPPLT